MHGDYNLFYPFVFAQMKRSVDDALQSFPNLREVQACLRVIPSKEKEFKRLFDEYSQKISYKQLYLDQNAFLVYYTNGFDGPGRKSIETEDPISKLESAQYGARNECWIGLDEARAEVGYLLDEGGKGDTGYLKKELEQASKAFSDYLNLAPPKDLEKALALIGETRS